MKKYILIFVPFIVFAGFHDPEVLKDNLNELVDPSEIKEVLDNIEDSEIFDAFASLISYMPAVDLVALEPQKYLNEVEYAFMVREEVPWGKDIPDEIWYNYVLPHRVSQEPLEYWREYLYTELKPVIDTCGSDVGAALAINRWCAEHVYFKQTQRQDQGVFETLKSGYGRCEEMAIIYVSALRACSIPARNAWTPYWTHSDNNHAWVEVWADGRWNFTGGCEPRDSLNDAWFAKSARTAAIVVTSCYGKPLSDEPIYKERDKFALIYSTDNYGIETGEIVVKTPPDSVEVSVSIYNWGALRTIMSNVSTGEVTFLANAGDYYVSAGDSTGFFDQLVHVESGKTVEVDAVLGEPAVDSRTLEMVFRKED